MNPRTTTRAGFSTLELLLAATIIGLLAAKFVMVFGEAVEDSNEEISQIALEDEARALLRRIAFAVMGSDRETLAPAIEAPLDSDDIRYRLNLGLQDGEIVWSDEEEIGLADDNPEVSWSRNPETLDEQRIVWSRMAAPFLQGELPNGMDDNGNGLIDERGLSFVVDGDAVTIRLTLDRPNGAGGRNQRTVQTVVTCRNLQETE